MGLLKKSVQNNAAPVPPSQAAANFEGFDHVRSGNTQTRAKVNIDENTAKTIATAYRCKNIISDDIAMIPFQQFRRVGRNVEHVSPDPITRNMAHLIEVQPNRWQTPFIFKKRIVEWLLFYGNAYIWEPPQAYRELYILNASLTRPVLTKSGEKVFETQFPNGKKETLPSVEVAHLLINPKTSGREGQGVLEFARETLGRTLAAKNTQADIQGNGLKAAAIIKVNASLDKDGRNKVREAYQESLEEPGGLAVFDNKVADFQTIEMKATDMQFIEGMALNEKDIMNFFGVPEYKLNSGKQSYQSNSQHDLDYLKTTLDPYLVQWEQTARINWTSQSEQATHYWKFIREAFLRMNAKERAELNEIKIRSGQATPNEAREVEDQPSYELGDKFWMSSNYQQIGAETNVPA